MKTEGLILDLGLFAAEFLNPADAVVCVNVVRAADQIAFLEPCRAGFSLLAENGQRLFVNELRCAPAPLEPRDDRAGRVVVVGPSVLDHAAPLGVGTQLGVEQAERRGENRKFLGVGDDEVRRAELWLAAREGDLHPLDLEGQGDGIGAGGLGIGPEEDSERSPLVGKYPQPPLQFHPVAHRQYGARDVKAVRAGEDLVRNVLGPRGVVGQRSYRQRLSLQSSASCDRPATPPLGHDEAGACVGLAFRSRLVGFCYRARLGCPPADDKPTF